MLASSGVFGGKVYRYTKGKPSMLSLTESAKLGELTSKSPVYALMLLSFLVT